MDYTPELPPHLKVNIHPDVNEDDFCPQLPPQLRSQQSDDAEDEFCPALPPHLKKLNKVQDEDEFCPQLPPHLCTKMSSTNSHIKKEGQNDICSREIEDDDEFCPSLPPHLINKHSSSQRILGPTVPRDYKPSVIANDRYLHDKMTSSSENEEDEEDPGSVYGPLPASKPVDMDRYIEETMQKRSKAMKDKISGKKDDGPPTRESWMLELPEDKPLFQGLGLQARQFSRRSKIDKGDTSVWTDTPVDKERKAQRAAERGTEIDEPVEETVENVAAQKRDEQLQKLVDDYNAKKRPAAMVDTHRISKKAKGEDTTSITGVGRDRKVFSREDDMHVNKFDEAQRATIMNKAKQLNDRFSSGKTAKYL